MSINESPTKPIIAKIALPTLVVLVLGIFVSIVAFTNTPAQATQVQDDKTLSLQAAVTTQSAKQSGTTMSLMATSKTAISKAKITLSKKTYTYNGSAKKPTVKVKLNGKTLKKGTDYKVSYKNNIKVGTAKVIVKGKGKYSGKKTVTFKIKKKSSSSSSSSSSGSYVLNTKSKVFHYSWCSSAKRMSSQNKSSCSSASKARAMGYTACKICKP